MTTNFATASYQEVIDLHTESGTMSAIGIHTPNTDTPTKMLSGFWNQFRKVKYLGCSVSLVPAARLPADPLQVSYEAGEPTIDPRDMLNPILFHGCHGDSLGSVLDWLYTGSLAVSGTNVDIQHTDSIVDYSTLARDTIADSLWESVYYRALTDRTWLKAHPQSGFRRSGLRPLVHRVVSNTPYAQLAGNGDTSGIQPSIVATNSSKGLGEIGVNSTLVNSYPRGIDVGADYGPAVGVKNSDTSFTLTSTRDFTASSFMTSRMEPLGWLDTYGRVPAGNSVRDSATVTGDNLVDTLENAIVKQQQMEVDHFVDSLQTVPKLFMGVILLPPAYKTEQYFRLVINHNFAFKGFRGVSMWSGDIDGVSKAVGYNNLN